MNHFAIALVLSSTLLHALWNLLARSERDIAGYIGRALVVVAVSGALPAIVAERLAEPFDGRVYLAACASGAACGFYYFFLALAYESGDFTVVYPVARSVPVVLVALADLVRGRYPTAAGWAGMVVVVIGCLLAPLTSLREVRLRRYVNVATAWMILAALGTVGYTMIDKVASEQVASGPLSAARYGYWFFAASLAAYGVLLVLLRGRRRCREGSAGWALPAAGGLASFAAYSLVLWAYQLARRASYVVAFRQFSIVVAVVVAFWWFRERGLAVRLTASIIITAGLVVIGLWGQ